MELIYSDHIGFCPGVKRALDMALDALEKAKRTGSKVYSYGSLVHNKRVSDYLKANGIIEIESPSDAEPSSFVIIRAHGASREEIREFEDMGSVIFDATCPIVRKSHEILKSTSNRKAVIGEREHAEVKALLKDFPEAVSIEKSGDLDGLEGLYFDAVVQTTLSETLLDEILNRAKDLNIKLSLLNEVCPQTEMRLASLFSLKGRVDAIAVVGDKTSSNTMGLLRSALCMDLPVYFAEDIRDVYGSLMKYKRVGVISGTSTPESLYTI